MPIGEQVEIKEHPHLVANKSLYQGITDFIEANHDVIVSSNYVTRYLTELEGEKGSQHFNNRLSRTYFTSFVEPYLSVHLAHMSQPISIDVPENTVMTDILQDTTGFEEDSETIARDRLWLYLMHGRCATLVEGPASVAEDKEAATDAGERSYQVLFTAPEVIAWQYFRSGPRRGKLKSITLALGSDDTMDGNEAQRLRRYFYPDGEDGYIVQELTHDKDATDKAKALDPTRGQLYVVTEEVPGTLDRIPVVIWGSGPDEHMTKQLFYANRADLNMGSVKTSVNYNQGFQRVFVTGTDLQEIQKVGESILTPLMNQEADVLTIQAGNPVALEAEQNANRQYMRRIGLMEHNQLLDDTREVQSAESKAADRQARLRWYNQVLDRQEEIERQIYELHALFEGLDAQADTITVTIARNFALEDPEAQMLKDMSTAQQARELGATEVQKEILRARIGEMMVIPRDKQTADDRRKELLALVDTAQPAARFDVGSFSPAPTQPTNGILSDIQ